MEKLPSKSQIVQWLADNPTLTSKRDIARAFGIKGGGLRIELKRMLKELEDEGALVKKHRSYRDPDALPPVSILAVLAPDADGDLFASAVEWNEDYDAPRILIVTKKSDPALGQGDRILARLEPVGGKDHAYEARLIRKLGHNPLKLLGIFRMESEGGRIVPVDKKNDKEWRVLRDGTMDARDGELVEAEQAGPRRMGLPQARITARLGDPSGPRAISLIAIQDRKSVV